MDEKSWNLNNDVSEFYENMKISSLIVKKYFINRCFKIIHLLSNVKPRSLRHLLGAIMLQNQY
jgi:hypothetical protein